MRSVGFSRPLAVSLVGGGSPSPVPIGYWKGGVDVGNLPNARTELSGLTAAQKPANDGSLWGVIDGSNEVIIALDGADGSESEAWTFTGSSSDVEDIDSALIDDQGWVIVADSGDNANARSTFKLFRIKEPTLTGSGGAIPGGDVEEIVVEFPGANTPSHKDVETVFLDPASGDIWVITKRITPILAYRLPYAASYAGTQTLVYMGALSNDATLNTLSITPSGNNGYVVGGTISPDGSEILLTSYEKVFLFSRDPATETILDALQTAPVDVAAYVGGGTQAEGVHPHGEPQGEAITFDRSGVNFFTCSEQISTYGSAASAFPLFRYDRLYDSAPVLHTFRQGESSYSGGLDCKIDSDSPSTDLSANLTLTCDYNWSSFPSSASRSRWGFLKFDLSSLSGETVVQAWIDFVIANEGYGIRIFPMNSAFAFDDTFSDFEASATILLSDASATPDFAIAASGLNGYASALRANLPPATLQAMIDSPASNHGWAIGGAYEATGDGMQVHANNAASVPNRPRLNVIVAG